MNVSLRRLLSFRRLSGDDNPLHRDDAFAEEMGGGKLRGHVCFGMLTASLLSTLAAFLFGFTDSLANNLQVVGLSSDLARMVPYVITIIALSLYAWRMVKPRRK